MAILLMSFPTGRQRRAAWAGTFGDGGWKVYVHDGVRTSPPPPKPYNAKASQSGTLTGKVVIQPGIAEVAAQFYLGNGIVEFSGVPHIGNIASVKGPFGTEAQGFDDKGVFQLVPSPKTFSGSASGSWSVEADLDEWVDIYAFDPTEAVYIDGTGFPHTGGNAMPDGLPALGIRRYEAMRVGGTCVTSAQAGAAVATVTEEITVPYEVIGYVTFLRLVSHAENFQAGYDGAATASNSCSASLSFAVTEAPNVPSGSRSTPHASCSWGGSSCNASTVANLISTTTGESNTAVVEFTAAPNTNYTFSGRLRAWKDAYPGSLTASVQGTGAGASSVALSPTGTLAIHQRNHLVQTVINGAGQTETAAYEIEPITAALTGMARPTPPGGDPESADVDDRRDWRLQFLGERWTAGNFSHAAGVGVLAAGAAAWTGVTSGGLGKILASGSAVATLDPPKHVWEAYRYATINLKGNGFANREVTITLANDRISKTYVVTTGADGEAVGRDFDTCSPTNRPSPFEVDRRDFRYPLRFQASGAESPIATGPEENGSYLDEINPDPGDPDATESVRGWLWGANRPTLVTISCSLEDGETLEIGALSLFRKSTPKLTFLDAFKGGPSGYDGYMKLWSSTAAGGDTTETGQVRGGPFALLNVDGRTAFDFPGSWHDEPVIGEPGFVFPSIAAMLGWLGAFPGCTATAASPSGAWANNDNFALYLGGSGATYQHPNWTDWVDVDAAAVTLIAQELWDRVQAYPGCGDVWGTGNFGGPLVLRCSKNLRGRAWGLVFEEEGEPIGGANVTAYETSGPLAIVGTASTDVRGSYRTALPHGRGPVDDTTRVGTTGSTDNEIWRNRRQARTSFLHVPETSRDVHLCEIPRVGMAAAITTAEGVTVWVFDLLEPDEKTPAIEAANIGSAQLACHPAGHLVLFYDQAGEIKSVRSYNRARTWTEEEMIAPGVNPAPAIDRKSGVEYCAGWVNPNWRLFRKLGKGEDWQDLGVIVTMANGRAGLEIHPGSLRELVFVAPDLRRFVSTNQGKTWEEQ